MGLRLFDYSLKNIPLANDHPYKMSLLQKTIDVISKMRWKAHFFGKGVKPSSVSSNFGFKSSNFAPQNENMKPFERDLVVLINGVCYKRENSDFLSKLNNDCKKISNCQNLIVPADKTSNHYEISKDLYLKLLNDNISKTYRKVDRNVVETINREAKYIAEKHGLSDKMEKLAEKQAFLTIKDHKAGFNIDNPKCRLLNPTKSDVGKVSKIILEKINITIKQKLKVNSWQSTSEVISWFNALADKPRRKFIKFDIEEFYPSISKKVLEDALDWAKNFCDISELDILTIMNARKSILRDPSGDIWVKKDNEDLFDVTMGSFDGAQVCELIGLRILESLNSRFDGDFGLYRDDGLASFANMSGPESERLKKNIISLFKEFGFKIEISCNLQSIDFLDVFFDLRNETFCPYTKPNDQNMYVNVKSNHPHNIIKQIPTMINSRLSKLSSSKQQFDKNKDFFNKKLQDSGYKHDLVFNNIKHVAKNRSRNILWFNPPFNKNVKTNIARQFLNLIDKHFPANNILHKIFNRNTLKVSYGCMPNMKSMISRHNKFILNSEQPINAGCNCRVKADCPLEGKCLTDGVIYQASVTADNKEFIYIGSCSTSFKDRYRDHACSFNNSRYKTKTELSNHVWELKDKNINFELKWKILSRAAPYKNGGSNCNLCLKEKMFILKADRTKVLNNLDLILKCRHKFKFKLKNS